ncbi:MAG: hypothetical protein H7066_04160 [Cytophagaceae bacterium]|nr:hypothetical protein [Gemmatimonadaceae bacterium]
MEHTRRGFVQQMTVGAVGMAGLPSFEMSLPSDLRVDSAAQAPAWDISWTTRLRGKHKACFDCTEPESGYGVWRASAWAGQYMDVMKVTPSDLSPVIILRHNAIVLAMQQSFWDTYAIGKSKGVTHPLTAEPTTKNPALLDEKDGIPAPFNNAALHKQLGRGVVALACNLALQDCVELVKKADGVSDEEARKRAVAALVPGVILQPSGVFAAVKAQESGCAYVKAS